MRAVWRYGWDDRETAEAYERFCEGETRYHTANRELVRQAELDAGMRVLDHAAGIGLTAEAALADGADDLRVVCEERSPAMQERGARGLPEAEWCTRADGSFDRVLCGAAVWQIADFGSWLVDVRGRLRPGGALAFNVPAAYLGLMDDPGGGADPQLVKLPARIAELAVHSPTTQPSESGWGLRSSEEVDGALRAGGFTMRRWSFRYRLTLREYAAWLTIPVLTNELLPHQRVAERQRTIEAAMVDLDATSWKWEGWCGWTARI